MKSPSRNTEMEYDAELEEKEKKKEEHEQQDHDGGDDNDDDYLSDTDSSSSQTSTGSNFSTLTGLSDLSGREWKPAMKPSPWIRKEMQSGTNPRTILAQLLPNGTVISGELSDLSLWRILASMMSEPPHRHKLRHINTIDDCIHLIRTCRNIVVLTGAGVSVSCGIPDFRSKDGIYSRLADDFPGLPDPQAMFDIAYFSKDPRPFYKFAREIYPGQFKPSMCHEFLKRLETKRKLLRNYTQNIDTLEQVAGIENVIECHGSFATASCTNCKFKMTANAIRADILAQTIPLCPECEAVRYRRDDAVEQLPAPPPYQDLVEMGIMKPDIVFFGEGLPDSFHTAIASDKDKCDLLIVIGSSLKVHPVALIPRSLPRTVPQILINREQLCQFDFDVELLGDSDTIIAQLCYLLGDDYKDIAKDAVQLSESIKLLDEIKIVDETNVTINNDSKSITAASNLIGYCDSGFESTSSSSNLGSKLEFIDNKRLDDATTKLDGIEQFEQRIRRNFELLQRNDENNGNEMIIKTSNNYGKELTGNGSSCRNSVTERLCSRTYYRHTKKGIYVFPGAQVYFNSSDSSDDDDDGSTTTISDDRSTNGIEEIGQRRSDDLCNDSSSPPIKKPRSDVRLRVESSE